MADSPRTMQSHFIQYCVKRVSSEVLKKEKHIWLSEQYENMLEGEPWYSKMHESCKVNTIMETEIAHCLDMTLLWHWTLKQKSDKRREEGGLASYASRIYSPVTHNSCSLTAQGMFCISGHPRDLNFCNIERQSHAPSLRPPIMPISLSLTSWKVHLQITHRFRPYSAVEWRDTAR